MVLAIENASNALLFFVGEFLLFLTIIKGIGYSQGILNENYKNLESSRREDLDIFRKQVELIKRIHRQKYRSLLKEFFENNNDLIKDAEKKMYREKKTEGVIPGSVFYFLQLDPYCFACPSLNSDAQEGSFEETKTASNLMRLFYVGAGDENRTRDLLLGKEMFYH